MPPPQRPNAAPYRFHMYDYPGSAPYQLSPAQPAGRQFYSLVQDLDNLRATALAKNIPSVALVDLGPQIPGDGGVNRGIRMLSFGGAVNSPAVVITGGIHAREWLAPEMAYLLAEYLIVNYPTNAFGLTAKQRAIQSLIQNRRIHILPMVNPNGQYYTTTNGAQAVRLWRKNRRTLPTTAAGWVAALGTPNGPNQPFTNLHITDEGMCNLDAPFYEPPNIPPGVGDGFTQEMAVTQIGVDLNRNFGTPAFGYLCAPKHEDANPRKDGYCGPRARSETETQELEQLFQNLAGSGGVGTSIDYHSYSKVILYPTEEGYAGIDAAYTTVGKSLRALIAPQGTGTDYELGSPKDLVTYDGTGILADRIVEVTKSRGFVVELDPALNQNYLASFQPPEALIQPTFEKNIRGALGMIAAAGDGRGVIPFLNRWTADSGARDFLAWNVAGLGNQLPA